MPNKETSQTYIGTTQAAFRLHLSVQRVRKLAIEGRIKGAFREGGRWKIPVSASGMPKISSKKKGPKGRWRIHKQEIMNYIHVNQAKIRSNRKHDTCHPVISVKMGQKTVLCNEVKIPGVGRLIYDQEKRRAQAPSF
ncbi:DNA-binding protein [Crocosphaera sp. Alani8]|uniref:DNA-binding protein n=1 Tax=Crocosphaera sp. Alani8 TaxID=3038952 RepID=UPI00313CF191